MKKVSLGLLVVLLLVAIVGIMTQNGKATTITWLSVAPLLLYVAVAGISWLVISLRK